MTKSITGANPIGRPMDSNVRLMPDDGDSFEHLEFQTDIEGLVRM